MIIEMRRAAAEVQGGVATIAAALQITREAIYQWRTVPPRHVHTIVRVTDGAVTPTDLRPDLWPPT
jgi:DNA-binding transcriptional regulator YdaS (Cro superfamily)